MRPETLCRNYRFEDPTHPRPDTDTDTDTDTWACPLCVVEASAYPPAPAQITEVHDGITFTRPTWDPAPAPWNDRGSWVHDPETDAQVLRGIRDALRARGFDERALLREAATATPAPRGGYPCGTFWGSHGCSRPQNHPGLCVCINTFYDPQDQPHHEICSAGLKWSTPDPDSPDFDPDAKGTFILWWHGTDLCPHYWMWVE